MHLAHRGVGRPGVLGRRSVHEVEHGPGRVRVALVEQPHGEPADVRDPPDVRRLAARDQPEQRRLARAVRAEHPHPVTVVQAERHAVEQGPGAHRQTDPVETEQVAHSTRAPATGPTAVRVSSA